VSKIFSILTTFFLIIVRQMFSNHIKSCAFRVIFLKCETEEVFFGCEGQKHARVVTDGALKEETRDKLRAYSEILTALLMETGKKVTINQLRWVFAGSRSTIAARNVGSFGERKSAMEILVCTLALFFSVTTSGMIPVWRKLFSLGGR